MIDKLLQCLEYEQSLVHELIELAGKQQRALVKFDMRMLDEVIAKLDKTSAELRQAEEQRINMITNWLKISRREAAELRLSYLERIIDRHNAGLIENIKNEMKAMFKSLKEINTTNRVLANRARRTVSHILSSFTNGRNQVCNVKI